MRLVEITESRAPRVHQMDAGIPGPWCECLNLYPAPDERSHDVAVDRRVVETRPAVAQRDQRAEDRATRSACARIALLMPLVLLEKREQTFEMLGDRRTRTKRTQFAHNLAQHVSGAKCPFHATAHWIAGFPCLEQPIERLGIAKVACLGKSAIERRDVITAELEVR